MDSYVLAQKSSLISKRISTMSAIICTLVGLYSTPALAGNLTPPGPPGPTMRTMEQLKPTWDKLITATERFVDALDGTAVLDKETGLVWQKTVSDSATDWLSANIACSNASSGGRQGWRLPTVPELMSLTDQLASKEFSIPTVNPFTRSQLGEYWTTTPYTGAANTYFTVFFAEKSPVNPSLILVHSHTAILDQAGQRNYWCVRGGQ